VSRYTERRPLNRSLGEFAIKDIDRLNLASELLASAATACDRMATASATSIRELVFQSNQLILAVMKKPADKFARWHERNAPKPIEADNG
jgi:hypothetical protein